MKTSEHILVVDDQKDICEVIEQYLSSEGYQVSVADGGAAMRRIMGQHKIDLVILDLVMPGEDGLALARQLREASGVGIIMLTGRAETVDRIIGLEMGADDYLPKPFHLRELLARVKSVLRRVSARGDEAKEKMTGTPARVRFDGWQLDLSTRDLMSPHGGEVRLTSGEFDLLAVFVSNPHQVLSRDRLLDLARNREAGPFDRTIDVQVGRLRRKIEPDAEHPTMIKTVRGIGYIFTPTVETD